MTNTMSRLFDDTHFVWILSYHSMDRAKRPLPNKGLLGGVLGTVGDGVGGLANTAGDAGE